MDSHRKGNCMEKHTSFEGNMRGDLEQPPCPARVPSGLYRDPMREPDASCSGFLASAQTKGMRL